MKTLLIIATLTLCSMAHADSSSYMIAGKEVSKADAVKALLQDPKTDVTRVQHVELTDKLTLKVRKVNKD